MKRREVWGGEARMEDETDRRQIGPIEDPAYSLREGGDGTITGGPRPCFGKEWERKRNGFGNQGRAGFVDIGSKRKR